MIAIEAHVLACRYKVACAHVVWHVISTLLVVKHPLRA